MRNIRNVKFSYCNRIASTYLRNRQIARKIYMKRMESSIVEYNLYIYTYIDEVDLAGSKNYVKKILFEILNQTNYFVT